MSSMGQSRQPRSPNCYDRRIENLAKSESSEEIAPTMQKAEPRVARPDQMNFERSIQVWCPAPTGQPMGKGNLHVRDSSQWGRVHSAFIAVQ